MPQLGKRPATHDPRDLLLSRYTVDREIPVTPVTDLGHPEFFPKDWGMLGNDQYGDCVLAGGDHEHILWDAESSTAVRFSEQTALADYSALTGFNPKDPTTDQGTDMRAAMNYRRTTGLVDADGHRHKIGAFVALQPGNIAQLKQCIWLFGTVAIGIEFPQSAMDQFNSQEPWTVVKGSPIEGGHYVPGVLYHADTDMFEVVTWGARQLVAPSFLQKYMDEAYGVLSEEMLSGGKSLEGLDVAALKQDLADIGNRVTPTPGPPPPPPNGAPPPVEDWWTSVESWAAARHTGANRKAAEASKQLAGAYGLT